MDVEPQIPGQNIDPQTSPAFEGLRPPGLEYESKTQGFEPVFQAPPATNDNRGPVLGLSSSAAEVRSSNPKVEFKTPLNIDRNRGVNRAKTELRLRYEAEISVIQKQIGSLEKIRTDLGLSARKICQLLMVDPSAWNRWSKPGGKAPPHIWRALQWYIISQEKLPGLTPNFFLSRPMIPPPTKLDPGFAKQVQGIESSHRDMQQRIQLLEDKAQQLIEELRTSQRTVRLYEFAGALIGFLILGFVIFLFLRSRS